MIVRLITGYAYHRSGRVHRAESLSHVARAKPWEKPKKRRRSCRIYFLPLCFPIAMNLLHLRRQIRAGRVRVEFVVHALTEAFKDGLTMEELRGAVLKGEIIEDYGTRALLLTFTTPDRIPYHVVVEYFSGDRVATVVTAYIPDTSHWESDWKHRKKLHRKRRS